jgi:large subunit ribosomal protein L10
MSRTVKNLMMRDVRDRVDGFDDALVLSIRGVPARTTNEMRLELNKKNIKIAVVRNNLAKHVFAESGLKALAPVLKGPSAVAFGGASVVDVAREIMAWAKKVEQLELKGAVLDGELFVGKAGVERLSKMPTREEAIAQTVVLVLSPGRKLAAAIKGPGSRLASVVKSIEEKLEKGEAIAKVG